MPVSAPRRSARPLPQRVATARLLLREFRVEDVRQLVPLLDDWRVARWLANVPHPYTPAYAREWVEAADTYRVDRRALCLLVASAVDDRPIGGIEINLERAEIGYWIGVPFQRQGFATEAVRALLPVAFDTLGLPGLTAATLPENERSARVLAKAGFEDLGVREYDFMLRGGVRPGRMHHLTAARWRTLNGEGVS